MALSLSSMFVSDALDATGLFPPPSIKVMTNICDETGGPVGCSQTGPPATSHPVLRFGQDIFWPLSYDDGRESFAIVVTTETGGSGNVVDFFEAEGARYIDSIHVDKEHQTVIFTGQSSHNATVSWDHLVDLSKTCCGRSGEVGTSYLDLRRLERRQDSSYDSNDTGAGDSVFIKADFALVVIALVALIVVIVLLFLLERRTRAKNMNIAMDRQNGS